MLALLLFQPLAPFGAVAVERASDGGGVSIQITGTVDAPIRDVEAVLLDVRGYVDWFPNVQTVHPQDGGAFEATFRMPWPLRNIRETLRLERWSAGKRVAIHWSQVRGDFARDEGAWLLRGRGPSRTEVRYVALLQFRRWIPHWLIRRAERRGAPRLLGALEERARRLRDQRTASLR